MDLTPAEIATLEQELREFKTLIASIELDLKAFKAQKARKQQATIKKLPELKAALRTVARR